MNYLKTTPPNSAHCFDIIYSSGEIAAAFQQAHGTPGTIQEFPMRYPLSEMKFAWPNHGQQYPATGSPWASGCSDTSSLQKFPLVPASITGTTEGKPNAWNGQGTRSSDIGNGQTQSDFIFQDGSGNFCLIATETPLGTDGWLPCVWE
ncbi:MAG: hypothetical protein Q9219_001806 [cf. Caloplaca sp. 3 TL-2023]